MYDKVVSVQFAMSTAAATAQFVAESGVEGSEKPAYLAGNASWFLDGTNTDGTTTQLPWSQSQDSNYGPSHTINYYAYGQSGGYGGTSGWSGCYDQGAAPVTGSNEATQLGWGGYGTGRYYLTDQETPWRQDSSYNTGYYPTAELRGSGSDPEAQNWTPDFSGSHMSPWWSAGDRISPWLMSYRWHYPPVYATEYVKEERDDYDVTSQNNRPAIGSTQLVYQVCYMRRLLLVPLAFYRPL